MRHLELERWSQRSSFLHHRHSAAVTLGCLLALVSCALVRPGEIHALSLHFIAAVTAVLVARLPLAGVLFRAMGVLPFSGLFAGLRAALGDADQAIALLIKSYTSAMIVLVLVGVLGLPRLMHALGRLGVPKPLVLITQFLYRYLLVLAGEAQGMLRAARCRLGGANRNATFAAASGGVSVLFARSYGRAERIHGALLSRGFQGGMPELRVERFGLLDLTAPAFSLLLLSTHLPWR